MSAFEIVVIVVGVLGILLAATRYFRTRRTVSHLGESPESFAHPETARSASGQMRMRATSRCQSGLCVERADRGP